MSDGGEGKLPGNLCFPGECREKSGSPAAAAPGSAADGLSVQNRRAFYAVTELFLAKHLGYDPDWVDPLPEATVESFAGTPEVPGLPAGVNVD